MSGIVAIENQSTAAVAGPEAAGEGGPKQPVAAVPRWPGSFSLEPGELLAESEDFQGVSAGERTKTRNATRILGKNRAMNPRL